MLKEELSENKLTKFNKYPIGHKHYFLEVVSLPYYKIEPNRKTVYVDCKCICSKIHPVPYHNLRRDDCKSCGCFKREESGKRLRKGTLALNGVKICSKCRLEYPDKFFSSEPERKDGLRPSCRKCDRNKHLKRTYGISVEEYDSLLSKQNGQCSCCGIHINDWIARGKISFVVDHCHRTDKIRGLLCEDCNLGIGRLGDSIEGIKKALNYLERFEDEARRTET